MKTGAVLHGRGLCVGVRRKKRMAATAMALASACLLMTAASVSSAQSLPTVSMENLERSIKAAETVTPLKSDLFGESVSLYNGSTEFRATDVSLAGNNLLPVELSRRLVVDVNSHYSTVGGFASIVQTLGGFGRWDIDVPYIYGTVDQTFGWSNGHNGSRCSSTTIPKISELFNLSDVWTGIRMNLPGQGEQQLMVLEAQHARPADGHNYVWGTRSLHRARCIPSVNGMDGEGFEILDTNGLTYRFDIAVSRDAGLLSRTIFNNIGESGTVFLHRQNVYLMASRVEDRNGNYVNYVYQDGSLVSIQSNDGRRIDINYAGKLITSVVADGRTWQYHYQGASLAGAPLLHEVVLPDSSRWSYGYEGDQEVEFQYVHDDPLACGGVLTSAPAYAVSIQHPSGAQGRFDFLYTLHYMSGTPASAYCYVEFDPISQQPRRLLGLAPYFFSYSLALKEISGPGLDAQSWTYSYGWPATAEASFGGPYCTSCDPAKSVFVTDPDGTVTEHRFGALWGFNNGELIAKYTRNSAGRIVRSEVNTFVSEEEGPLMPFPNTHGLAYSHDSSTQWNRPVKLTKIAIDGDIAPPVYWTAPPPPPPPPPCEFDCLPPPPICDPMTGICQDPMSQLAATSASEARRLERWSNQADTAQVDESAPNVFIRQVEAFDSLAFPVQTRNWSQAGE